MDLFSFVIKKSDIKLSINSISPFEVERALVSVACIRNGPIYVCSILLKTSSHLFCGDQGCEKDTDFLPINRLYEVSIECHLHVVLSIGCLPGYLLGGAVSVRSDSLEAC